MIFAALLTMVSPVEVKYKIHPRDTKLSLRPKTKRKLAFKRQQFKEYNYSVVKNMRTPYEN